MIPPKDIEAEQALLGAAFIDTAAIAAAVEAGLTKSDFYHESNGALYECMCRMADAGEPIDLMSVRSAVNGAVDPAYISDISDCAGTAVNADYYAGRVRASAIRRRVIHVGHTIIKQAQGKEIETDAVLEMAEREIYALRSGGVKNEGLRHVRDISDTLAAIEERIKNPRSVGLTTGYSALDDITSGLQPGDLVIIAGRPSMGKTAIAVNMAVNAALPSQRECRRSDDAAAAAVFSLEMTYEGIKERLLASVGGVSLSKIRGGRGLTQDDMGRIVYAATQIGGMPLYVDDTPARTTSGIRSQCRMLHNRLSKDDQRLGLVVVDYLQLMTHQAQNREQEIAGISRDLKALAKELNIPVIALSQLNRNVEARSDKRPTMADLRESGAIEQDADLIMFVYREFVYSQRQKDEGKAEILIRKHRQGPTGDVKMVFDAPFCRYRSLDQWRT
jgi:replicative DNA helicase